ncbi:MAG TPA: DnaJ domain-containing protein [Thermodesulfobacteriota bacterium]|nr:DnaJ domain-containing protein [Thermodesulfobacteriota bacterium]
MGLQRALVIGSDEDSCSLIKGFLESKGLSTALIQDFEQGVERLLYEKPDIAVVVLIQSGPDYSFISRVEESGIYELVDFESGSVSRGLKPLLVLEDDKQTNSLISFLAWYLKNERGHSFEKLEEKGDLSDISYPDLLAGIYHGKRTGILTLSSGVKLEVYFMDGVPVYAEGGDFETALGRVLLDCGHIQKTEYDSAMSIALKKNQKIGHVLIEMGLVSPHELSSLLELQVKEKIIRGFQYTMGRYVFKPGSNFIQGFVAYPIKLPQILYEGIKRYVETGYIEEYFLLNQGVNPTIQIVPNLMEEVSGGGLNPRELRFVQLRKDGTGISDIVEKSVLGKDETLKLLFFLYLVGYIKVPEVEESKTKRAPVKESYERPSAADYEVSKPSVEDVINLDEEIIGIDLDSNEENPYLRSSKEDGDIDGSTEWENYKQGAVKNTGRRKMRMNKGVETNPTEEEGRSDVKDRKRTREEKEALVNEILKLYSTLDEKNHYQILGVEIDSGKEKIKEAYFSLVKKLHPDANPDLSKEIRHKAEQVFVKIAEAYETLSDDEKRADYDTQLETSDVRSHLKEYYEAELAYKKGNAFLKQRSYDEAEGEFKKAVELNPNEAAYVGALAWAAFLTAIDKDQVLNSVREQLEKAISLNPEIAEIYYYLGCIYKHINLKSDAEASFAKALQCNPNYLEAKRELWLLQKRKPEKYEDREKKGKGFWSNLFKK